MAIKVQIRNTANTVVAMRDLGPDDAAVLALIQKVYSPPNVAQQVLDHMVALEVAYLEVQVKEQRYAADIQAVKDGQAAEKTAFDAVIPPVQ